MDLFGGKGKAPVRRKTAKKPLKKRASVKKTTKTPARRPSKRHVTRRTKSKVARKTVKRIPVPKKTRERTSVTRKKALPRSTVKRPAPPVRRKPSSPVRPPVKRPSLVPSPVKRPSVSFTPPVSAAKFVRKVKFRTKSPERPKGYAMQIDHDKYWFTLQYLIRNGQYGDAICDSFAALNYDESTRRLESNEGIIWSLIQCPRKVIAINLRVVLGLQGHANILIINKHQTPWEIERFEPHGSSATGLYDMNHLDSSLKNFFSSILAKSGIEIDYKGPLDICPRYGPQARAEENAELDGFCQTWVLWYLDARLTNPHLTGKEILEEVFQIPPEELYEMVQDYVYFVMNLVFSSSEVKLIRHKQVLATSYASTMKDLRKDKRFSIEEKDELSLLLYNLLVSTEDTEMMIFCARLMNRVRLALHSRENFPHCRQLLKALVGRTVSSQLGEKIENVLDMMILKNEKSDVLAVNIAAIMESLSK